MKIQTKGSFLLLGNFNKDIQNRFINQTLITPIFFLEIRVIGF